MMNNMCEGVTMLRRVLEIIVQVVDMHVSVAEAAAWRNVKVTDNFVDPNSTLDPASFFTLRVETLCIPFLLTLLNIFAPAKSPRD